MIWLFVIPIFLLLLSFADMPSGFYTILRIVVCLSCTFCAFLSYGSDKKVGVGTITYGFMAILFNPIIPVYLYDKGIWGVIDIIAIILIAGKYFQIKDEF